MLEEDNLMLSSNQESTTKDQRKSIECYSEKAWRNLQNCGIDPWTSNFEDTPGWIGLKFDIFKLMFNEILVMHMHNSQLVYNFYEQAIKLFL